MNKKRKIKGNEITPRVVFSESNMFVRVQAVDDIKSHTLIFLSTQKQKPKEKKRKTKNSLQKKGICFKIG
jgi:ribosomal protein L18